MKSLLHCWDPGKAGENFIPAKRDHVINPLEILQNSQENTCARVSKNTFFIEHIRATAS